MSYLFNDAQIVRKQILALVALNPELEEDATLLADMVEGETDLNRILEKLVSERRDAETLSSAIKEREGDLYERRKRMERKADGVKKIMLQLMEAAQQDKITLPEATLSITKPRTSVEIIDIDALPQGFFRTERKALSSEIKAALEGGERIPGAQLALGNAGLTIRTK